MNRRGSGFKRKQSSSRRGFHGIRNYTSQFPSPKPVGARGDEAKTSEYAYFKKLKEDASLMHDHDATHDKEHDSRKFKPSECLEKKTRPTKRSACSRSSLENENVAPVNIYSNPSTSGSASKFSGAPYTHSDLFGTTRQKLREFDDFLFTGIGELRSRGFHSSHFGRSAMVSSEDPNLCQADTDAISNLLHSPEPDNQLQVPQQPPERVLESGGRPSLNTGLTTCWLGISRGRNQSSSGSSTGNSYIHIQRRTRDFASQPEGSADVWDEQIHCEEPFNFYDQINSSWPKERSRIHPCRCIDNRRHEDNSSVLNSHATFSHRDNLDEPFSGNVLCSFFSTPTQGDTFPHYRPATWSATRISSSGDSRREELLLRTGQCSMSKILLDGGQQHHITEALCSPRIVSDSEWLNTPGNGFSRKLQKDTTDLVKLLGREGISEAVVANELNDWSHGSDDGQTFSDEDGILAKDWSPFSHEILLGRANEVMTSATR